MVSRWSWKVAQSQIFFFIAEFVVVHNGIITNYKDIKKFLVSEQLMDTFVEVQSTVELVELWK